MVLPFVAWLIMFVKPPRRIKQKRSILMLKLAPELIGFVGVHRAGTVVQGEQVRATLRRTVRVPKQAPKRLF